MRRARFVHYGVLIAVAGAFACGEDLRPSRMDLSLDDREGLQGVEIRITDEIESRVFDIGDFGMPASFIGPFRVADRGTVSIQVTLRDGDRVIADGRAAFRLQPEHRWGVRISRQIEDPDNELCFGCVGSARVDLAPDDQRVTGEALWISWGGGPLDAVF